MNHEILLTPRYKINEVNNQHNYVDMRLIYVNKKIYYVEMQHNSSYMLKSPSPIHFVKLPDFFAQRISFK